MRKYSDGGRIHLSPDHYNRVSSVLQDTDLEKLFNERNYKDLKAIGIRYLSVTLQLQRFLEKRLNEDWLLKTNPYEAPENSDVSKIFGPDAEKMQF